MLPIRLLMPSALLLFVVAPTVAAERATMARNLVQSDRTLVIAHRGDSLTNPENTLPAFASAVEAGADLVELDYVHSADGVPVVIHDTTLDRTTDACQVFGSEKILVKDKLLAELLKLDAGKWFDDSFAGTRLPTLEEALDTIQNGSVTLIERKQGDAKTCVELLRRKGLVHEVVVQSFDWKFLADCYELEPDLVIGALGLEEFKPAQLKTIEKTGAKVIGWQAKSLTPEAIEQMHDAGYKVWAWTVDRPAQAQQLVEWGADGIITNAPARIRALVAETALAE